ncbi:MAG TPA: hypothetical protein P5096_01885 [Patescibacteria group bacterium]|nr:hypothetical protein [Patescibacteria group bacterium]
MKVTNIDQAILFTVHYFDTYQHPPTFFEVWRYLFCYQATIDHVILRLDELIRRGEIEEKNGFYFLPGKSHYLDIRQKRYDISEKLWNRAIRAARILSYLPFIKSVIVNNSLARFNCDKDSDIDFLIITQKDKIWTVKLLSSTLLWIFRLKRQGRKVAKRVCLSMYLSESEMNIDYLAPKDREFFLPFWIAENAPILDYDKTFQKYKKENEWIKKYLPNSSHFITDYFINFRQPLLAKSVRNALSLLFQPKIFENFFRYLQTKMIAKKQEKLGNPFSVIFNDHLLKFHVNNWKRLQTKDWNKVIHDLSNYN